MPILEIKWWSVLVRDGPVEMFKIYSFKSTVHTFDREHTKQNKDTPPPPPRPARNYNQ